MKCAFTYVQNGKPRRYRPYAPPMDLKRAQCLCTIAKSMHEDSIITAIVERFWVHYPCEDCGETACEHRNRKRDLSDLLAEYESLKANGVVA
jgi:hypothetical protein